MARQTSKQAYHNIKNNGLLSALRFKVYEWLYNNGPATAQDVTSGLAKGSQDHGSYSTRLSELREIGVVKECGTVKSKHTGHNVIEWDVTSNLPTKLKPKKQKKQEERSLLRRAYKILEGQMGKPDVDEFLAEARKVLKIPEPKVVTGGAPASLLSKMRKSDE